MDGFEHHRSRKQFREDRRRDRRARELGYVVLRFTWEDVMHAWPKVVAEILASVGNDYHRLAPRPQGGRRSRRSTPPLDDPKRRTESPRGWPVPSPSIPVGGSGRASAVDTAATTATTPGTASGPHPSEGERATRESLAQAEVT